MTSVKYYENTVKMLWNALNQTNEAEPEDFTRWLDLVTAAITALEVFMVDPDLDRAERQRCQTSMSHLHFIQNQLTSLLRVGGDLQEPAAAAAPAEEPGVQWQEIRSAFRNRIRTGVIVNHGHLDILTFLNDARTVFNAQVQSALNEHNALKVNAELVAQYSVRKSDGEESVEVKYFNTKNIAIYQTTDRLELFDELVRRKILTDMEDFQERDSGWTLKAILGLNININMLNPLRGSSYIPLPPFIANKKACINVHNDDNQCFKWAVLSALFPAAPHTNPNRVNSYRDHEHDVRFKGLKYPVYPKDIAKFEKSSNISINLYMLKKINERFDVSPCHLTALKRPDHVNLLLIQDFYIDESIDSPIEEDENDQDYIPKFHYVYIKDMSKLIRKQLADKKSKCYICDRCMHYFWTNDKLVAHEQDCSQMNQCRIELPSKKESILEFEHHKRSGLVPIVIYADLESLLKPTNGGEDERAIQDHEAHSVGIYIKYSFKDQGSTYKSYRKTTNEGMTPAAWFILQLKSLMIELEEMYKNAKEMNLSNTEQTAYAEAKRCYICNKPFNAKDGKVRDHCHLTGRFRGAAHNSCNLKYQNAKFIPIVFHNLTGYDSHFIIKEIATADELKGHVYVLAENKERYISFSKYIDGSSIYFRFIDSFRFMPSSLEKLASYLEETPIVQKEFEKDNYTADQIQLLRRKGVFPYEYISSLDKLNEEELPPKDGFHSTLMDGDISDEDYEHAQNVWRSLDIKTLGEYSDIYLKTDVVLLADVFESFRKTCLQAYQLDPLHYYTTPGLTWDAMLKLTNVKLDLLTDIDMVMFIEKGIRGGVSQCSNRYAKANNPYMGEEYDESQESTYLMYYDVNNLYGWAMTQSLPYADFQWVDDVDTPNFFDVPDDSPIGFIVEVDLLYPRELHDVHKDLPICPEHRAPPGSTQKKLLTTLYNKERYVLHYRALKQALAYGLRLVKVHRALKFKQSPWLKPYVDLNTAKRKEARNEFDKLFYKLMVNAVYGKTMENERCRTDVKLINKWEGRYGAEARIAAPNFHSSSIFDENLVAIQLSWTTISITKPIYVGLSVLDLSKTLVYDFHYGYMRQRLGDKCKLLYTDTDSLVYEVKEVDMYAVMKKDIAKFDTSDYPENNPYGLPRVNKKVLGLMKDECGGNIMLEFIGLRSKMYSVCIQGEKPIKKAKGVKSHTVKNTISIEDYRRCLREEEIIKREQFTIRSRLHKVRTERERKVALSPHDDKRCLMINSPDTLPWGHYNSLQPAALIERVAAYRRCGRRKNQEEGEAASAARVRGVGQQLQKRRPNSPSHSRLASSSSSSSSSSANHSQSYEDEDDDEFQHPDRKRRRILDQ